MCLGAAGRFDEAYDLTVTVLEQCAAAGLVRYPSDGGDEFRRLVEHVASGVRAGERAEAGSLSPDFLDRVIGDET